VFTFRKLLLFVAACDPENENERNDGGIERKKLNIYIILSICR